MEPYVIAEDLSICCAVRSNHPHAHRGRNDPSKLHSSCMGACAKRPALVLIISKARCLWTPKEDEKKERKTQTECIATASHQPYTNARSTGRHTRTDFLRAPEGWFYPHPHQALLFHKCSHNSKAKHPSSHALEDSISPSCFVMQRCVLFVRETFSFINLF